MADKVYSIQVTLTDGTEIPAGEFIVPAGDKGDDGVSITGVTLTEVTGE